jgi:hypothetical protein
MIFMQIESYVIFFTVGVILAHELTYDTLPEPRLGSTPHTTLTICDGQQASRTGELCVVMCYVVCDMSVQSRRAKSTSAKRVLIRQQGLDLDGEASGQRPHIYKDYLLVISFLVAH